MTDKDASSSQNLRPRRTARQAGPHGQHGPPAHGPQDQQGRSSYETGESSAAGSLLIDAAGHDVGSEAALAARSADDVQPPPETRPEASLHPAGEDGRRDSKGGHRTHKHRSSGAFLLSDAIFDNSTDDAHQAPSHRHQRNTSENHTPKGLSTTHAPENKLHHSSYSSTGPSRTSEAGSRHSGGSFEGLTRPAMGTRDSFNREVGPNVSVKPSVAPLDVDSAQIVNMALNLSESRRLASRRVSQPLPPKLAPLPDSSAGGSLRQHLQQQRRASRTISPKPDKGVMPRVSSAPRIASRLQTTLDPLHDGSYRYHFSQSTLARAQKAKEYLELLAQYRRVLEFLPPLKPAQSGRASTVSPPSSPTTATGAAYFGGVDPGEKLGRLYNPLQYIRNRKVRARERKAIDGEDQGFADIVKVTDWVDDVAKYVATGQARTPGSSLLPSFASADESMQSSPPSNTARPTSAPSKPRRPRVDWFADPSDMLADVYWLEQEDNKKLVEDRHWRRVFPQDVDLYRPLSRQTDEAPMLAVTPGSLKDRPKADTSEETPPLETKPAKAEHEHIFSGARERARQKLHDIKGLHHRHSSSIHSHDFLHIHRGSISDSSDTDSDRRRRNRNGTIGSSGIDILEKQMVEMIAKEAMDNEYRGAYDPEARRTRPPNPGLVTPERRKTAPSAVSSRPPSRSQMGSGPELSDPEDNSLASRVRPESPLQHPGRVSLEVPSFTRRISMEYESSQPNSPELRPSRIDGLVPVIGMDLSPPSSRPGSPPHNPFSKVKRVFRDRSRERNPEAPSVEKGDATGLVSPPPERLVDSPGTPQERQRSPERRGSGSPVQKTISRSTNESHKGHRSHGSIRLRGDDPAVGLRGLFKGPRIDSVLRGGVSKVAEMLWRKEPDVADVPSSSTSSDESEMERKRGRPRGSAVPSRANSHRRHDDTTQHGGRSYLEVMPTFVPTSEAHGKSTSDASLLAPQPSSSPTSRRSSRFDLLKPPRIDVQNPSPPPPLLRAPREVDASDSDSRKSGSYTDGVREADARLNAILSAPQPLPLPFDANNPMRLPTAADARARQWSISNRSPSPERALAPPSRREIARLRALVLSSGVLAMEISRRSTEPRRPGGGEDSTAILPLFPPPDPSAGPASTVSWRDIARLAPPDQRPALAAAVLSQAELYPLAGRVLAGSVASLTRDWQTTADGFATEDAPALQRRVDALRNKLGGELSGLTRAAADEADEVGRDLVTGQRLKVKRVVDVIEKMLRRRRRRFRWVRRAGWLAVEWVLVGFMWYVWFVVMIARVVLGVGSGVVKGVRWLLWL